MSLFLLSGLLQSYHFWFSTVAMSILVYGIWLVVGKDRGH